MTQKQQILDYMEQYGGITSLEAFHAIGCTRLSGRIYDLKRDGVAIKTETVQVPTRSGTALVTRYSLAKE